MFSIRILGFKHYEIDPRTEIVYNSPILRENISESNYTIGFSITEGVKFGFLSISGSLSISALFPISGCCLQGVD